MNSQSPTGDASLDALHAHQVVLFAVASLAELRESDTESHLLRVKHYVRLLAEKLQSNPAFTAQLSTAYIDAVCAGVSMYDLGTVAIPDRILLKPGRLTADELAIMQSHTTLGHEACACREVSGPNLDPALFRQGNDLVPPRKVERQGLSQRLVGNTDSAVGPPACAGRCV